MREVLFRGKTLYDGEWMFGSLVKVEDECVIIAEDAVYYGGSDFSKGCSVDPATVGQFTGLTDKNGKRIFEGDVVRCDSGRICKVVYFASPGVAQFDLLPVAAFDTPIPSLWNLFTASEVIGNIHDNPELVEV